MEELNQAYINFRRSSLANTSFNTQSIPRLFLLKFGILGLFTVVLYGAHTVVNIRLLRTTWTCFFVLFIVLNLTDDF
jgi:hypothetical protein